MRRHLSQRLTLAVLFPILACTADPVPSALDSPGTHGEQLEVHLELSASGPAPGDLLAVAVRVTGPASDRLGALQGLLRFDPASLTYVGQADQEHGHTEVGATYADAGLLLLASFDPAGLPPRTAILIFRARQRDGLGPLSYAAQVAGSTDLAALHPLKVSDPVVMGDLAPTTVLSHGELLARVFAQYGGRTLTAKDAPGAAAIYGDATSDQVVNVMDAVAVSAAAVGARSIVADAFIAGNVAPANLPGLGELGDTPPGDESDGQTSLDVLDALAIARISVGIATPIVGRAIPAARLGPRVIVTPNPASASAQTDACHDKRMQGGDWADAATGKTWPECIADDGKPMVIQFCAYAKLDTGEWLPSTDTSGAGRCMAELPLVQAGGS